MANPNARAAARGLELRRNAQQQHSLRLSLSHLSRSDAIFYIAFCFQNHRMEERLRDTTLLDGIATASLQPKFCISMEFGNNIAPVHCKTTTACVHIRRLWQTHVSPAGPSGLGPCRPPPSQCSRRLHARITTLERPQHLDLICRWSAGYRRTPKALGGRDGENGQEAWGRQAGGSGGAIPPEGLSVAWAEGGRRGREGQVHAWCEFITFSPRADRTIKLILVHCHSVSLLVS